MCVRAKCEKELNQHSVSEMNRRDYFLSLCAAGVLYRKPHSGLSLNQPDLVDAAKSVVLEPYVDPLPIPSIMRLKSELPPSFSPGK